MILKKIKRKFKYQNSKKQRKDNNYYNNKKVVNPTTSFPFCCKGKKITSKQLTELFYRVTHSENRNSQSIHEFSLVTSF